MGYRSDVAYAIKFKSFEERDAYVVSLRLKSDPLLTDVLGECVLHTDEPLITFRAEDVKWYQGYPWVSAHTQIYQGAEEVYAAQYICVALGEDGKTETEYSEDVYDMSNYVDVIHRIETSF